MCPYLTYLRSAQLFLAVHLRSACVRMCVCLCSFLSALHLACNLHYYTVYTWPLEHTFSAPNPKVNSQPQSPLILATLRTFSSSSTPHPGRSFRFTQPSSRSPLSNFSAQLSRMRVPNGRHSWGFNPVPASVPLRHYVFFFIYMDRARGSWPKTSFLRGSN